MKLFHWVNIHSSMNGFTSQKSSNSQNVSRSLTHQSLGICKWCLSLPNEAAASQMRLRREALPSSRTPWPVNKSPLCQCPLRPGETGPDWREGGRVILVGMIMASPCWEVRICGWRKCTALTQFTTQQPILCVLSTPTVLGQVLSKPPPAIPPNVFAWVSLPTPWYAQ